jgi:small membrane protein
MIIIFKILFSIFVVFVCISVFQKQQKQLLTYTGAIFWVIFWLAAWVIVLWPVIVQYFADKLDIGRGSDLVSYISIALLFYIVFKLYIKIARIKQNITQIVREVALIKRSNDDV